MLFQKSPFKVIGGENTSNRLPSPNQKTELKKLPPHDKTEKKNSTKTTQPSNELQSAVRKRATPCPYCRKILSRSDGLRPHILALHPGQKVPVRVTSSPIQPPKGGPVRVTSSPIQPPKGGPVRVTSSPIQPPKGGENGAVVKPKKKKEDKSSVKKSRSAPSVKSNVVAPKKTNAPSEPGKGRHCMLSCLHCLKSVLWIRIRIGSVFPIRIRIHACKCRIKCRQKV